jgi:hypothetical protein
MKKLEPIRGPINLDLALEYARKGRPDLLLFLIGDAMGADVAETLAELFKHPEKLLVKHRAAVLPHEAEIIRKIAPDGHLRDAFARHLGMETNTLRDIIERKKTYAEEKIGERPRKRSPHKRIK